MRQHGIEQFIRHYRRVEAIEGDMLRWGDELEYGIFKIDEQGHSVRLSLRAPEIMKQLRQREEAAGDSAGAPAPNQRELFVAKPAECVPRSCAGLGGCERHVAQLLTGLRTWSKSPACFPTGVGNALFRDDHNIITVVVGSSGLDYGRLAKR